MRVVDPSFNEMPIQRQALFNCCPAQKNARGEANRLARLYRKTALPGWIRAVRETSRSPQSVGQPNKEVRIVSHTLPEFQDRFRFRLIADCAIRSLIVAR
jgi:hypothetical protein